MKTGLSDLYWVIKNEVRHIFRDRGVMLIFFVAGIAYPLLYNGIYKNESVYEIPIAVVDQSSSLQSREFLKKLNATQEVRISNRCLNMEEAKALFMDGKVHGIVFIPSDYHIKLARMEQATISIFNDMSSFLYYKGLMMATNYTMLDELRQIQINRYNAAGIGGEQAEQLVEAIPGNDVALYNPGGGFASFLLPAMLILIIHQTLFFGIGMMAGTAREESRTHSQIPDHMQDRGIYKVVFGRAIAYFLLYIPITAYIVGFIPKFFNLPHIGNIWTLSGFMIPFLLAAIFFSMTLSVFVKNRETGLITFLFFTIILLFLSGFSWPRQNMPEIWKWISYLFPSTHGIQGYIKINSSGATLSQVRFEYVQLWLQAVLYLLASTISLSLVVKKEKTTTQR
ncbi:MAG: ABC transporter permease [Bacteroidales bacterium]|nr:ABC transporter permease [Bacteroidales bacterium]